jgi:senataxin
LILLCHGIKKLILVGDHKQLSATVFYPKAKNILYNRSLFERLLNNNLEKNILTIQYRMQANIRQVISSLFYENKLLDSPDVNFIHKKNNSDLYKVIDINKNFYFFDLNFSEEKFDETNKSYYNEQEIEFSLQFLKKINNSLKNNQYINNNNDYNYNYAIITPYQAQVKKLKEKIYKYKDQDLFGIDIKINTVDSFQGQERDIIIFSTVRANNKSSGINNGEIESIGFLNDYRRMNVGLSRAKLGCFIIGNSLKLKKDHYWEKLIHLCKGKKCIYSIDSINKYEKAMESVFLNK